MSCQIELRNVCLQYGLRDVVRDVSVQIEEGEFFVIIGPNGAGKTTLLKSITALHRLDLLGRFCSGRDRSVNIPGKSWPALWQWCHSISMPNSRSLLLKRSSWAAIRIWVCWQWKANAILK